MIVPGGLPRLEMSPLGLASGRRWLAEISVDDLHRMDREGPTWAGLRALSDTPDLPVEWRHARSRMLDLLERHLGAEWPEDMWRRHQTVPLHLFEGATHTLACLELLELALRLDLHEHRPGFGAVRKILRNEPTSEAGAHVRLQLEVASLVAAVGATPAFEQRLTEDGRPIDVLVTRPDQHKIAIETFNLFTDQAFRLASAYSTSVSQRIVMAGITNDVSCETQLFAEMSDEETRDWLTRVEEAAREVAQGGDPRTVEASSARSLVGPRGATTSNTIFEGPPIEVNSWPRILMKLLGKTVQTESQLETWIRLDLMNGTWQLTPWAATPLPEKLALFQHAIGEAMQDPPPHLAGVIITNGAGYGPPELTDESSAAESGSSCLRRRLWPFRVRETLILPLRSGAAASTDLLRRAYAAEPAWLDQTLTATGLEPVGGLWSPQPDRR
jgi:hypothetical protein